MFICLFKKENRQHLSFSFFSMLELLNKYLKIAINVKIDWELTLTAASFSWLITWWAKGNMEGNHNSNNLHIF